MKLRRGFVSNSSSSSYVCDVCGGIEEGWDISLHEAEMFTCVNHHTVHTSCTPDFDSAMARATLNTFNALSDERKQELEITPEIAQDPALLAEYMEIEMDEWRYYAPEVLCPICSLDKLSVSDELAYYRQKHGYAAESTLEELRETFKTYGRFKKFLKGK